MSISSPRLVTELKITSKNKIEESNLLGIYSIR